MRFWTRFLALACACFCLLAGAAGAEERIALVIGNGAYRMPGWQLANPPRDAALIAERLRSLGFTVDLVTDAGRSAMEAAFQRHGERLKAAGPSAVGIFFYAGHGAQEDGINYLIPVDADAQTADRLRYQSPALQFLFDDMAETGNAVNLVILDACRNMPLPSGARSVGRGGLADVGRLPNMFIAYAAAPGQVAADGTGRNSPFSTALAAALASPTDDPIELVFSDVQAQVYQATQGGQSPEYRNGLVRAPRWRLRGGATLTPTSQPPPPATQPTPARHPLAAYGADVVAAAEAGDWERVAAIGWDFGAGANGRSRTPAAALALGRAACERNNASGCTLQGRQLLGGDRANWPVAIQALQRGCTAGSARACGLLGGHYITRVVPADYAQAYRYYRLACDGGLATACGGLGIATAFGQGVAKNTAAAVPLLRRSCDGGDAPACSVLAGLLRTGDGAPRDVNGALLLLQRGCVAQDLGSCHLLAEMYAAGEGGPRNPTLAAQTYRQSLLLLQRACGEGVAPSCAQIGWYHDNGLGVPINRDQAIRYYRQALQLDATNALARARLGQLGAGP
ncbi:MAG: caspase family protein [Hyphomonadaceae bacterium]|nr:caspase family protein [Hyphomonadaceae bacterium]